MASQATNSSSALASLTEAEESLRELSSSDFNEVKSFAKPPLACLSIFECVGILLEPTKQTWEWTDDKKLMAVGHNQFLKRLFDLDKDHINQEQITKLNSILDQYECQPKELKNISQLCYTLGKWLRAILLYTKQQQQT
ncbi:unnamed protein product [Adineta steineri]|uniref:Dynein heavy chain coiled coil stalk domain-containing protein n=2 Tax=Adineta steineri TaxID=433720 RepID=A0A818LHI3_9BILA|nr:unnamed protein product [Adineta steineri]CAF3569938.1 unnamed protein product [Adineta steineri]